MKFPKTVTIDGQLFELVPHSNNSNKAEPSGYLLRPIPKDIAGGMYIEFPITLNLSLKKPPTYEILRLRLPPPTDFVYGIAESTQEEYIRRYKLGHPIHTVRRLSDGEVLTVGDKYENISGKFIIERFEIEDGQCFVYAEEFGCCNLNNITKVKPKEFEITAFRVTGGDGKTFRKRGKGGLFYIGSCPPVTEQNLLGDENYEIYSVKRLSDKVEFNIGDGFAWNTNELFGTIKSFELRDNTVYIRAEEGGGRWNIKHIGKYKEPLFQSEDGFPLYEGDNYIVVETRGYKVCDSSHILDQTCNQENARKCGYIWFKKKVNAENWCRENKPKFTEKDIKKACEELDKYPGFAKTDYLKTLLNIKD